eukprot:5875931-Prymnesium_polylepis.2
MGDERTASRVHAFRARRVGGVWAHHLSVLGVVGHRQAPHEDDAAVVDCEEPGARKFGSAAEPAE